MKKLLSILAILFFAGCTNDDYTIDGPGGKTISSFKATVEDSPVTRAHFETETKMTWDKNDVIHVISDKQKDAVKFTYENDGTFTGSPINYENTIYAVYSPTGNAIIEWDNMATEATLNPTPTHNPNGYAGETFMVAKSSNKELIFRQTVGILKFSLKGTKLITTLTLKDNNNEVIAGTGKVDLTADEPIIVLDEGGSTSITMQADVTLQEEEATCFYFQVPVICFENGFTLTVEGEDATTGEYFKVEKRTDKPIDIARNFIHSFTGLDIDERLQELFEDIEINPAYVPVNWDITQIISRDTESGYYSFDLTNETKNIRKGSVLTVMHDNNIDIVLVENVIKDANTVSVSTIPGSLNNIFANTSFTLSFGDDTTTRSSISNRVFYPVKTIYQDDEGNYIELNEAQTRALSVTGKKELWDTHYSESGAIIHQGEHHKIYLEKSNIDANMDVALTLSYGSIDKNYKTFTSKPDVVKAELRGNMSTEQIIRADIFGKEKVDCIPIMLKTDIFRPVQRLFMIANIVPVYIVCFGDLLFDGDASYNYNGSFYTGFTDNATGTIGIKWEADKGISHINEYESDFNIIYPTIEGYGEIKEKIHVFPRINILVNNLNAVNLDLKPYARIELKGGFKEELLSSSKDFCAWSFDSYVGFDLAGGIDLNIYKQGKSISIEDINIIESQLYMSPKSLKYLTESKIELGTKNTLTFGIYDHISLLNKIIETPLPQLLKFESKKIVTYLQNMALQ